MTYSRRSEAKGNSGQTAGWNREHIWCNSYGIDSKKPAYTDLFNLLPADWSVNSSRGNLFYDYSDSDDSKYKVPGFHEAPLTLRKLAERMEGEEIVGRDVSHVGPDGMEIVSETTGFIKDTNGNTCGAWEIEEVDDKIRITTT